MFKYVLILATFLTPLSAVSGETSSTVVIFVDVASADPSAPVGYPDLLRHDIGEELAKFGLIPTDPEKPIPEHTLTFQIKLGIYKDQTQIVSTLFNDDDGHVLFYDPLWIDVASQRAIGSRLRNDLTKFRERFTRRIQYLFRWHQINGPKLLASCIYPPLPAGDGDWNYFLYLTAKYPERLSDKGIKNIYHVTGIPNQALSEWCQSNDNASSAVTPGSFEASVFGQTFSFDGGNRRIMVTLEIRNQEPVTSDVLVAADPNETAASIAEAVTSMAGK